MENLVISREYVEKNYIHKDKIREYIRELQYIKINEKSRFTAIYINANRKQKILEEILGETYIEDNDTFIGEE